MGKNQSQRQRQRRAWHTMYHTRASRIAFRGIFDERLKPGRPLESGAGRTAWGLARDGRAGNKAPKRHQKDHALHDAPLPHDLPPEAKPQLERSLACTPSSLTQWHSFDTAHRCLCPYPAAPPPRPAGQTPYLIAINICSSIAANRTFYASRVPPVQSRRVIRAPPVCRAPTITISRRHRHRRRPSPSTLPSPGVTDSLRSCRLASFVVLGLPANSASFLFALSHLTSFSSDPRFRRSLRNHETGRTGSESAKTPPHNRRKSGTKRPCYRPTSVSAVPRARQSVECKAEASGTYLDPDAVTRVWTIRSITAIHVLAHCSIRTIVWNV